MTATLKTTVIQEPNSGSANITLATDGSVDLQAGTATSPSMSVVGDTNTGLYFPAADNVAVSTGGSERLRVSSAGQIGIGGANYGSSGQVIVSGGSGAAPSWGSSVVLGTAQNSTSGTAINFTDIPSWVRRITVMFSGVSTNGTSMLIVQIGSGSYTTSGYLGSGVQNGAAATFTTGFVLAYAGAAADVRHGSVVITKITGNSWVSSGSFGLSNAAGAGSVGGSVSLSGTLDRLRITTVNGTDTFDAGSINIMYE